MSVRLWVGAAIFHAIVLLAAWLSVRRWVSDRRFSVRATIAIAFTASACAALALSAALISWSRFTALRLLAQLVFGEMPIGAAWLATRLLGRGRSFAGAAAATFAFALMCVYVEAYHRGPHDLRVRAHVLASRTSVPHPPLRILHLSDIQAAHIGTQEEEALRRAQELAADLIVLTGDYVQERADGTTPELRRRFRDLLIRHALKAPLGVFAVKGDVEDDDWPRLFAGTGVVCLRDTAAVLALPGGARLSIVGLDSGTSRGRDAGWVRTVVRRGEGTDLRLVIGHSPDFVTALDAGTPVDLALAGHTHGGQVVLPMVGPLLTLSRLPRLFAADLHEYGAVPLHVSRGIGMERGTAPQIRFLCPPEMCVIRLLPAQAAAGTTRDSRRIPTYSAMANRKTTSAMTPKTTRPATVRSWGHSSSTAALAAT